MKRKTIDNEESPKNIYDDTNKVFGTSNKVMHDSGAKPTQQNTGRDQKIGMINKSATKNTAETIAATKYILEMSILTELSEGKQDSQLHRSRTSTEKQRVSQKMRTKLDEKELAIAR